MLVIATSALEGTRSFQVSRGLTPTTLYLCAACVKALCAAGGVPEPRMGE